MHIQRFLLPATIAAAIHAALAFAFNPEPAPLISMVDKPPALQSVKLIEPPVELPPEDKYSANKPVRPLAGGPPPPDLAPPPAKPMPDSTFVPADERRWNFHPDVRVVPTSFGPENIGAVGTEDWAGHLPGVGELDRVPRTTVRVAPEYPASMRQTSVGGSVTVEFEVDSSGRVVRAEAVRSTRREFGEAAVRAVLKWRFEPGQRHGRAVPFRLSLPVEFGLAVD